VVTAMVAVLAAAAGVTIVGGLLAAVLLLESVIGAPPAGAGALSVTVPVEDCAPPITLVGFSASDERVGGGGAAAVTVSEAALVTPPYDAEIVTAVDAATALLLTVN